MFSGHPSSKITNIICSYSVALYAGVDEAAIKALQNLKASNVKFGLMSAIPYDYPWNETAGSELLIPYADYHIKDSNVIMSTKMALEAGKAKPENSLIINGDQLFLWKAMQNFSDLSTLWMSPTAKPSEKRRDIHYFANDFKQAMVIVQQLTI